MPRLSERRIFPGRFASSTATSSPSSRTARRMGAAGSAYFFRLENRLSNTRQMSSVRMYSR